MKLPKATELMNSPQGLQWRLVHHGQARLESTRRSSIILAAFSFSVFSSLQLSQPSACPGWLFTALALNSAILVAMHSFSFIISTFLLPKLQAVAQEYRPPHEGDVSIKNVPEFSPHERFSGFVGISYNISHTLGLFLFLVEVVLIAWVKFYDLSFNACIASTVIMIPFMIIFAGFCIHFHRTLNKHVYKTRSNLIEDVEREFSEEVLSMSPLQHRPIWSLDVQASPRLSDISISSRKSSLREAMDESSFIDKTQHGIVNKTFVSDQ